MASSDPARPGLQIVVSTLLFALGVLDAISGLSDGNDFLGWAGVVLALVAGGWLVLSVRRYQRSRQTL